MKQVLKIVWLLIIQIFVINGTYGRTWGENTTASKPDLEDDFENMKPSPSVLTRRHIVESNETAIFSQGQSVEARAKKKHKKSLDIWKWDYRCQKQPVIGRCKEEHQRYFYDISRKECMKFTYSGCDGNRNNFRSLYDCDKNCKGTLTPVSTNTSDKSFCAMQPDAGMCFNVLHRFYYDINQGKCLKFIYGGCGGNDNNFKYESECIKVCNHVIVEESKENLRDGDDDSSSD